MKKITTFIFAIILVFALVACDRCNPKVEYKQNPSITNPTRTITSLEEKVGNVTYKYEVKAGQLYLSLKKDIGNSILLKIVDTFLLDEYVKAITDNKIKETIEKDVFGTEEEKEKLTEVEMEEKINEFLDTMFISFGCIETEITGDSIKEHYRLTLAEKEYALEVLKKEYKEHNEKYEEYNALSDDEKEEALKKAEENEETLITTPYYADSSFASKYNQDNYNTYNAIIIPFSSTRQAEIALQACGIYLNDKNEWVDSNGVLLTPIEILNKHIKLYEYLYNKQGLTVSSEEFEYTEDELKSFDSNIYNRITTSLETYTENSSTNNPDWYYQVPFKTAGGAIHAYVIKLAETKVTAFDDLSDEDKEDQKEKYLPDLFESSLTTNYIGLQVAKLREKNNIVIYDTVLELAYANTVSSFQDVTFEKTIESKSNIVCSITGKDITADELFSEMLDDYGLSGAGDELVRQRLLTNTSYNKYYNTNTKAWDKEKEKEINEIIKTEKKNFKDGVYKDEGYSQSVCTWETFLEAVYGVSNEDDLKIYLLVDNIESEYRKSHNYITTYTGTKTTDYKFNMSLEDALESNLWKQIEANMQKAVDEYFSVKGIHLLILKSDATTPGVSGSPIDPKEWDDTLNTEAVNLYNEIIAYLSDTKGSYKEKFLKIEEAFKFAPYADGSFEFNGDAVATTLVGDTDKVINISKYKGLGLTVKFEDLGTFTNGQMVEEFNDAVLEIWKKDTENSKTNNITLADDVIKTKFGYHIYVNLNSSTLSYIEVITTKDENDNDIKTNRYLPTLKEIRDYTLNSSTSEVKQSAKTAITKYYTPLLNEIKNENFTYAVRFNELNKFKDSFVMEGYTPADFDRYTRIYVEFIFDEYLSKINADFLD